MKPIIPLGVWPTMVTPFTRDDKVDFGCLRELVEWYIDHGVDGLFAVCQSSEMFLLSLEERVGIARCVVETARGRVGVVASGHTAESPLQQVEELHAIASTGVDAVVMLTNRLARVGESDAVLQSRVQHILEQVPGTYFGLYECPYPYKRLLSPDLLRSLTQTGRFLFLKDTSCDLQQMKEKLQQVAGTDLRLFNANAATLLASLKLGCAGYSGVMANFHPHLYKWLVANWRQNPEAAERLQQFLGVASLVERQCYPVNAKYHLKLEGVPMQLRSRVREVGEFTAASRMEIDQLNSMGHRFTQEYTEMGFHRDFVFGDERPFASCHASTLVVQPNEDVVVAWFGGSKEGADDVAIWLSRRIDGVWESPRKIAGQQGVPHWNPVLYRHPNGTLDLFFKVGRTIPQWSTYVASSTDDGMTWSEPHPLVPGDVGGRGPVKNKPIRLKDGTLVAPASVEGALWDAFVDISDDQGQNWSKSELVPLRRHVCDQGEVAVDPPPVPGSSLTGKGVIQPTLWESGAGMHMLLRSSSGRIIRSDSYDGGRTWLAGYPTCLPNNNSGIDVVRLPNGWLVLAYNPVEENWGPRTPLVLSVSCDNGATWGNELVLEQDPGEYSYPAIVAQGDRVYVTYTWKRERIAFCQIDFGVIERHHQQALR